MKLNFKSHIRPSISWIILICFTTISVLPTPQALAQAVSAFGLPMAGNMVKLSEGFKPALMLGIKVDPQDPLHFEFLMTDGQQALNSSDREFEYRKFIKYFLAALTTPEEDMWVNLSPYEEQRVIPESFSRTEMGRDLLAQDYLLKQISASLAYPEDKIGEEFWGKLYKKAQDVLGNKEIPLNTFNKIWIYPESATVLEDGLTAVVGESHLKVMMEQDFLALKKNAFNSEIGTDKMAPQTVDQASEVSSSVIKEMLLPEIEKEVNQGKHFANLRQVVNAIILATWYKKKLKDSILSKVYVDQNKVKGIDVVDQGDKQKIYEQYVEAFRKGVYNYIKEDFDPTTEDIIPRKYFSGGFVVKGFKPGVKSANKGAVNDAIVEGGGDGVTSVTADLSPVEKTVVDQKVENAYAEAFKMIKEAGASGRAAASLELFLKFNPNSDNVDSRLTNVQWKALVARLNKEFPGLNISDSCSNCNVGINPGIGADNLKNLGVEIIGSATKEVGFSASGKDKQVAIIVHKMHEKVADWTQENYDHIVSQRADPYALSEAILNRDKSNEEPLLTNALDIYAHNLNVVMANAYDRASKDPKGAGIFVPTPTENGSVNFFLIAARNISRGIEESEEAYKSRVIDYAQQIADNNRAVEQDDMARAVLIPKYVAEYKAELEKLRLKVNQESDFSHLIDRRPLDVVDAVLQQAIEKAAAEAEQQRQLEVSVKEQLGLLRTKVIIKLGVVSYFKFRRALNLAEGMIANADFQGAKAQLDQLQPEIDLAFGKVSPFTATSQVAVQEPVEVKPKLSATVMDFLRREYNTVFLSFLSRTIDLAKPVVAQQAVMPIEQVVRKIVRKNSLLGAEQTEALIKAEINPVAYLALKYQSLQNERNVSDEELLSYAYQISQANAEVEKLVEVDGGVLDAEMKKTLVGYMFVPRFNRLIVGEGLKANIPAAEIEKARAFLNSPEEQLRIKQERQQKTTRSTLTNERQAMLALRGDLKQQLEGLRKELNDAGYIGTKEEWEKRLSLIFSAIERGENVIAQEEMAYWILDFDEANVPTGNFLKAQEVYKGKNNLVLLFSLIRVFSQLDQELSAEAEVTYVQLGLFELRNRKLTGILQKLLKEGINAENGDLEIFFGNVTDKQLEAQKSLGGIRKNGNIGLTAEEVSLYELIDQELLRRKGSRDVTRDSSSKPAIQSELVAKFTQNGKLKRDNTKVFNLRNQELRVKAYREWADVSVVDMDLLGGLGSIPADFKLISGKSVQEALIDIADSYYRGDSSNELDDTTFKILEGLMSELFGQLKPDFKERSEGVARSLFLSLQRVVKDLPKLVASRSDKAAVDQSGGDNSQSDKAVKAVDVLSRLRGELSELRMLVSIESFDQINNIGKQLLSFLAFELSQLEGEDVVRLKEVASRWSALSSIVDLDEFKYKEIRDMLADVESVILKAEMLASEVSAPAKADPAKAAPAPIAAPPAVSAAKKDFKNKLKPRIFEIIDSISITESDFRKMIEARKNAWPQLAENDPNESMWKSYELIIPLFFNENGIISVLNEREFLGFLQEVADEKWTPKPGGAAKVGIPLQPGQAVPAPAVPSAAPAPAVTATGASSEHFNDSSTVTNRLKWAQSMSDHKFQISDLQNLSLVPSYVLLSILFTSRFESDFIQDFITTGVMNPTLVDGNVIAVELYARFLNNSVDISLLKKEWQEGGSRTVVPWIIRTYPDGQASKPESGDSTAFDVVAPAPVAVLESVSAPESPKLVVEDLRVNVMEGDFYQNDLRAEEDRINPLEERKIFVKQISDEISTKSVKWGAGLPVGTLLVDASGRVFRIEVGMLQHVGELVNERVIFDDNSTLLYMFNERVKESEKITDAGNVLARSRIIGLDKNYSDRYKARQAAKRDLKDKLKPRIFEIIDSISITESDFRKMIEARKNAWPQLAENDPNESMWKSYELIIPLFFNENGIISVLNEREFLGFLQEVADEKWTPKPGGAAPGGIRPPGQGNGHLLSPDYVGGTGGSLPRSAEDLRNEYVEPLQAKIKEAKDRMAEKKGSRGLNLKELKDEEARLKQLYSTLRQDIEIQVERDKPSFNKAEKQKEVARIFNKMKQERDAVSAAEKQRYKEGLSNTVAPLDNLRAEIYAIENASPEDLIQGDPQLAQFIIDNNDGLNLFVKNGEKTKELKKLASEVDSWVNAATQNVGGIDVTGDLTDFKVKSTGAAADLPINMDFNWLLNENIEGFTPILREIIFGTPQTIPFLSQIFNGSGISDANPVGPITQNPIKDPYNSRKLLLAILKEQDSYISHA